MKIAENQQEMIEYISNFIVAKSNISTIVFEDTKDLILDFLDEYIEDEVNCLVKTTLSVVDAYSITKLTNKNGKISLIVKPYDDEYVENDIIMIEEFSVEDLDISDVEETFDADEVIVVGLEENHELEEEEYSCEECIKDNDYCDCDNCHLDTEEIDEEEQELELFLEEFVERIQDTQGCPCCIMDILKEVYYEGYVMGSDDETLSLYNALHEKLYGEN